MQSTRKLYQKIPEDHEENIVNLYEILVNQHWAEQDKMWQQKYSGMSWFIAMLVYKYLD